MVAEASPKSCPPKRGRKSGEIAIYTRLKARNLYLSQGLSHKLISEQTGLTTDQLMQLAHREGWTQLRKQQKIRLTQSSDAQAQAMQSEVLEAIASHSEQHALKSLERVGNALERDDENAARDAQSYSGCLRNLVNVARDIRRPAESVSEGARLNVFVLRVGDQVKAKETPVTEVSATLLNDSKV